MPTPTGQAPLLSPLFFPPSLVPRAAAVTLGIVTSGMETVCASEVDRHVPRYPGMLKQLGR